MPQDITRVLGAVDDYAATGQGDVGRPRDRAHEWRLRVGDIRVVFTLNPDDRRLIVLSVDRRDSIYR